MEMTDSGRLTAREGSGDQSFVSAGTRRRREEPPLTQKRPLEQMPREDREDVARDKPDAKRCERFVRASPGRQRRKRDLVQKVQAVTDRSCEDQKPAAQDSPQPQNGHLIATFTSV